MFSTNQEKLETSSPEQESIHLAVFRERLPRLQENRSPLDHFLLDLVHQEHRVDSDDGVQMNSKDCLVREQQNMKAVSEDIILDDQPLPSETKQLCDPLSLPGQIIPVSKRKTWPAWRNRFFKNWCEDTSGRIFSQCVYCKDEKYYVGGKSSFTNFSKHASKLHSAEWKTFSDHASNRTPIISSSDQDIEHVKQNSAVHDVVEVLEAVSEPTPPPGKMIPAFKQISWPAWRNKFFKNWCEDSSTGRIFSQCVYCNDDKYYVGGKSSFTNFTKHASKLHESEWRNFSAASETSQPPITLSNLIDRPIEKRQLDNRLIRIFTDGGAPLNLLRTPSFRKFIEVANPGYKLPTESTMRNQLLPQYYNDMNKIVLQRIEDCTSITLLIDIWPSGNMYVAFTLFGVTKSFDIFNCFLCLRTISRNSTSQTFVEELEGVLREWKISISSVACVIANRGAEMIRAFNLSFPSYVKSMELMLEEQNEVSPLWTLLDKSEIDFKDEADEMKIIRLGLSQTFLPLLPKYSSISITANDYQLSTTFLSPCFGHLIQLVIKDGLCAVKASVTAAVEHASQIINSVLKSACDINTFYQTTNVRLNHQFPTRWSSQYHLLNSLVCAFELDPVLQSKLDATTKIHPELSSVELELIKELLLIFQIFEEATTDFQNDNESLGKVIPAYLDMQVKVALTCDGPRGEILPNPTCPLAGRIIHCLEVAEQLRKSLKQHMEFVLCETSYVLGAILDPRFKMDWITSSSLKECSVVQCVKEELINRYRKLGEKNSNETADIADDNKINVEITGGDGVTPNRKRHSRWSLYSTISKRRPNPTEKVLEEFDIYLSEETSPMEYLCDDFQPILPPIRPLEYWKMNSARFPCLSAIARDLFSIPATSVNVDRLFSTAIDITSAQNNNTNGNLFSMLHCIKLNKNLLGVLDDEN